MIKKYKRLFSNEKAIDKSKSLIRKREQKLIRKKRLVMQEQNLDKKAKEIQSLLDNGELLIFNSDFDEFFGTDDIRIVMDNDTIKIELSSIEQPEEDIDPELEIDDEFERDSDLDDYSDLEYEDDNIEYLDIDEVDEFEPEDEIIDIEDEENIY